jgi:hypothetical protein
MNGGAGGLRAAMIAGGLAQIGCAAVAWRTTRNSATLDC